MPVRQYANAPATTLASSCTALATSIVVASTTGLPITFPYTLIIDRGTATEEAVSVTAAAGTTLTVTRGIDSTTAFAHTQNATVVHGITAQDIREANAHVNASSGVHGATGSVVGTTDSQTLTNKDLTSGTNTFPTSLVTLTGSQTLTNKTLTAPALTAPTATGSLAGFGGAFSTSAPTSTPASGSWTSASTAMRYTQIGKLVFYEVTVTITTPGTGSGDIFVPIPVTARASGPACGSGRSSFAGAAVEGFLSSTTSIRMTRFDGATIASATGTNTLCGWYEAA